TLSTSLERIMAFKVKVELLASYSLIYLLAGALSSPTISLVSTNGECTSKLCNKTADDMLLRMNEDMDPCDNFFEFSCGGFLKRSIPIDKDTISLEINVEEKLAEEVKDLLQRDVIKGPLIARTLIKKFMDTCLTSGNQSESGQHLLDDFKKLGGFPVLELDWNEERFDITDTLSDMFKNGFGRNALMSFQFYGHYNNTLLPYIDEPTIVPERDDLVNHLKNGNDSTVEAYFDLMVKTVHYLGAVPATSKCDMKEVLQFSMELANMAMTAVREDTGEKIVHIDHLYTYGREIDWLRLFENMFHTANVTSKEVAVISEQMMYGLNKLLKKFEKRTVANFLFWSMTFEALPHLNESFLSLWDEYRLKGLNLKNRTSKFQDCQGQISQVLGFALSSLYVSNIFSDALKSKIESMKTKLFSVFNESMYNVSWMDDGTKKNASKKIKDMRFFIGYVNEFANETAMNIYLSMFNFTDSFYENKKQVLASKYIKYMDLEKPMTPRETVALHTTTLNAFYQEMSNAAFVSAGVIHGNYIAENAEFNNYGKIGWILMHELSHAFDNVALERMYDHTTGYNDWWSNHST
ncbi:Uncharacterised protein PB.6800, partial [Pycnogonum litorale]